MFKNLLRSKSPRNLLFLFEILSLSLLFIYQKGDINENTLMTGIGLVLVIYLSNFLLNKISFGDNYIFLIVTMLISIGIVMIYRIDPKLGVKQLIWVSIGIALFFLSYLIMKHIKHWGEWIYLYIGTSYILFLMTFVFGSRRGGAINWISIGGFTLQIGRAHV